MVVGGLVAAILVDASFLFVGNWWSGPVIGLLVSVAILLAIFGGVALFVLNSVIGIAREW